MIFWSVAAGLVLAVVAAVVLPLVLARGRWARRAADFDLEVYRDQLAEVERNLERGIVGREEAEAAKAEIGRRILAADSRRRAAAGEGRPAPRPWTLRATAAGLAVLVPAAAVGLYLQLGSPGLPAQPFAERQAGGEGRLAQGEASPGSLDEAEQRLAERLARQPDDLQGWVLLGRTRMRLERFQGAAEAFRRAVALAPQEAELRAMYGEALTMAAGGQVTERAREAFRTAREAAPQDPRTRYYLALAAYQEGRVEEALESWERLAAAAPADAPWLSVVEQRVNAARRDLGLPETTLTARADDGDGAGDGTGDGGSGGEARGPTQEDMAAARDMSPEQRRQMIRGMVESLAQRLEDDPKDFQGWQRLIRSYSVLGEADKAQAALDEALEVFSGAPFVRRQLAAQARELGLEAPADVAAGAGAASREGDGERRGPTQEQMTAAEEMSPEARRQMIEGMVEGLARRLEDNPDDLEGWLRLGRSYDVLGKPEKAREAYARAAELAPEDVEVLTRYARAERAAAGNRPTETSERLVERVLELDPDNPEALWYTALVELQAGNRDKARALFDRVLAALPADAPQTAEVRRRIERLMDGG